MPSPTLESIEVSRKFGKFEALAPTSFTLEAGQIAAITGPNGSGKSTLLHCLTGLLRPSSGEVRIDGHDLYSDELDAKRALAFVPDVPRFYLELTAWEHLRFIAYAHEDQNGFEDRAAALLEELNISEARDLFPHNYSRGMRLKLGLAMALIRPFRVLVLDEPTSALDPEATQLLGQKLLDVAASGASVLLTSHNPDWVEMLGARRWTMRNGCLELDK